MSTLRSHLAISQDGYVSGAGEQAWTPHARVRGRMHNLSSRCAYAGLEGGEINEDDRARRDTVA